MGIFEPYRALGYITASVPFSVQRLGTETFVTVSVGKAFQIYDVSPLSPSFDSLWPFFWSFVVNNAYFWAGDSVTNVNPKFLFCGK